MSRQRAVLTIIALAGAAAGAFAQTTTNSTVTRDVSLPPVGLASSETAQINVLNTAANSSSGTAASCTGTVSFLNASGAVIGTASNFTVTAGQASSVALPYSKTAASARTLVRALVTLTESTSSAAPCDLQVSMETFDTSTGVTHLYIAGGGMGIGGGGPGFGR